MRGLEAEVGDGEQEQPEADVDEADERGRHDAGDGEDEEVALAATRPIALRAEDRGDEGIDRHGGRCRDREEQRAVLLAEEAHRPRTHRVRHDGEAEDRVREVVERPGKALGRAAGARHAAEAAPPRGRGQDGHRDGAGCAITRGS
jgi:hypothetical protein